MSETNPDPTRHTLTLPETETILSVIAEIDASKLNADNKDFHYQQNCGILQGVLQLSDITSCLYADKKKMVANMQNEDEKLKVLTALIKSLTELTNDGKREDAQKTLNETITKIAERDVQMPQAKELTDVLQTQIKQIKNSKVKLSTLHNHTQSSIQKIKGGNKIIQTVTKLPGQFLDAFQREPAIFLSNNLGLPGIVLGKVWYISLLFGFLPINILRFISLGFTDKEEVSDYFVKKCATNMRTGTKYTGGKRSSRRKSKNSKKSKKPKKKSLKRRRRTSKK